MDTHDALVRLATKMARLTDRPSPSKCWTWKGRTHQRGYVHVHALGREMSLPVAGFLLVRGRLPAGRARAAAKETRRTAEADGLVIGLGAPEGSGRTVLKLS